MSPAKRRMLTFSPERHRRLCTLVAEAGYPVTMKKMFGHEVFFLNGYLFAGANERGWFVHVGAAARDEALATDPCVARFEPLEGSVMKEYLLISDEGDRADALARWLDTAARFIAAQPPKATKKRGGGRPGE